MKNLSYIILVIIIIITTLPGCDKFFLDDCARSSGKVIFESRESADISYISLTDNVNLILEQGSAHSIRVEAGENIIGNIITEIDGNNLYIRNENHCNWVRSYSKEINVYVTVSSLDSINYRGSGEIISLDTIRNDSIKVDVWEGSGTINMKIDVDKSRLNLHYGTVDMIFSGYSGLTYIYASSYGPFHCQDLETKYTLINNRGTNDCYVRASLKLFAEIEYVGNIYYYGDPEEVLSNITGTGQLIKMD